MKTLLAAALLFGAAVTAHADDKGVQILPDATQILVSKDVGNERWSIGLDIDRATISGNVYRPNQAPAFVWCAITAIHGDLTAGGSLDASCLGANRCDQIPCGVNGDDWSLVGDVTIPGSFFLP